MALVPVSAGPAIKKTYRMKTITVYYYDFREKAHIPVTVPDDVADGLHLSERMVISEEYAKQILAIWTS